MVNFLQICIFIGFDHFIAKGLHILVMVCRGLPGMLILSLSILLVKVWLTLLRTGEGIRMIKHNLAEGSLKETVA